MKPIIFSALITLLLLQLCWAVDDPVILATPSPETNQSIVYIPAAAGQNITVSCVTNGGNLQTQWRDDTSANTILFNFGDGLPSTAVYSYLSVTPGHQQNLTIHGFTAELDRLMIACYGSGFHATDSMRVVFFIGIPIITLASANEVYTVIEFQDFYLDLIDSNITSFPPLVNGVWTIDGNKIDDSRIVTTNYNITIFNISRSYSDRAINLTVSNTAGKRSQEFVLNVVYQPEAIERGNSNSFALLGDVTNVTAAGSIGGNPFPNTTWIDPRGNEINSTGRFTQPAVGTLQIRNLQKSDFGNYTFVASNGIGSDSEITVSLVQFVEPGQPRNLTFIPQTLSSTGVTLEWIPPLMSGVPSFTDYVISLVSIGNPSILSTDVTLFELKSLNPGTHYIVTVRATSNVFPNGGEQSQSVSFTTTTTKPVIGSVVGFSRNGSINLQWNLTSTGGIPYADITIDAICGNLLNSEENLITYTCPRNCINSDLTGNDLVGPVHAGFRYRCVVTISNGVGLESISTSAINGMTGIPSSPMVETEETNLILSCQYPGVDLEEDFSFNVMAFDENDLNVAPYPITYRGNSEQVISITLPAGSYTIRVTSENPYGVSDGTSVTFIMHQSSTISPSPNMPSENEINVVVVSSVSGVVAAVFALAIVVLIIFVICAIHRRTKYRSVTFTENGKLPPQTRRQFDRPRIASVGSTVVY